METLISLALVYKLAILFSFIMLFLRVGLADVLLDLSRMGGRVSYLITAWTLVACLVIWVCTLIASASYFIYQIW